MLTMSSNEMYNKTKRFTQIWIFVLTGTITILLISGFIYQELTHRMFGNNPLSHNDFIVSISNMIIIDLLFYLVHLSTKIDSNGISFHFFPLHLKYRVYNWDEIETVYLRKYDPVSDYGGWGIRYSFKEGMAFTTVGNIGLQIVLKNGKKVLIGTQKNGEIKTLFAKLHISYTDNT